VSLTDRERREREDLIFLLGRGEFLRFLFRVIQTARIFSRTTDGANERDLSFDEGRRHLGLEILEMVEAGQTIPHPEGQPILTLIQTLLEEANSPGERKTHEGRRYDRTDELDEPDEDQPDSA
jgi:hypothetical protein